MRKLKVISLKTDEVLRLPLYHPCGELIHAPGEKVTAANIYLLQRLGIDDIVELSGDTEIQNFIFRAENDLLPVSGLELDAGLKADIYDSEGKLIHGQGTLFTSEIRDDLLISGTQAVFVSKQVDQASVSRVRNYREAVAALLNYDSDTKTIHNFAAKVPKVSHGRGKLTPEFVDRQIAEINLKVMPSGKPMSSFLNHNSDRMSRTEAYKLAHSAVVLNSAKEINNVFRNISQGKSVNGETIMNVSKEIIKCLMKDKDFLINLTNLKEDNYLLSHSVRVAIMATAIGTSVGYNPEQVMEIAAGGFLHDVGMLKVPKVILERTRQLNNDERAEVEKHPIYGLALLQNMTSIPHSAPFIAYQAHERSDGTGYPTRKGSLLIHDFAKIVAIADIYDALTSPRPYRDAMIPYKAMEEIVFLANKKRVDPVMVKAFLNTASLFPVGSWVEISDGRKGKVVAAGGKDCTRPVVCIMLDSSGKRLPKSVKINLHDVPEIQVKKAIDGKGLEISITDGF